MKPRYEITWFVNGVCEARDEMGSWLGVQLLRIFAKTLGFIDHDKHTIVIRKLP